MGQPSTQAKGACPFVTSVFGFNLVCWDVKGTRKKWGRKAKRARELALRAGAFVFFVDGADQRTHHGALQYLRRFLDQLGEAGRNKFVGVVLTKLDPGTKGRPEVVRGVEALERSLEELLAGRAHRIFRASVFFPPSVFEVFGELLARVAPEGRYLREYLEEVCRAMGSPFAAVHAVDGPHDQPLLFGRHVEPGSQVMEAARFLETTHAIAQDPAWPPAGSPAARPFSSGFDLVAQEFPVGQNRALFAILLPRHLFEQQASLRETFAKVVETLKDFLGAISKTIRGAPLAKPTFD